MKRPWHSLSDTENKYGRYAERTKTISLEDLIKFHGHFCGCLVEGATALRVAFDALFPDGVIDRTDLRIASKVSACGGDIGAYLTGARTRYSSYLLDEKLGASEYLVQRVSTGRTVRVSINAATYPTEVRKQMKKIQSGDFTPADIDLFQELQWAYAKRLVNRPAAESVDIADGSDYDWGRLRPAGTLASARTTTTSLSRRVDNPPSDRITRSHDRPTPEDPCSWNP